ncbi:MAG: ABC transporter ATP-binding protein [Planctomycetota bacterium]
MSPSAKVLLELRGVHKSFRMGELTVEVLRGVDLEVYAGEIAVVLGYSGSGKTTLLNIMGALDRPSAGTVLFEGWDLGLLDEGALAEHRRQNLGFVFQLYNLIPTLTAAENVAVATEGVEGGPMDPREALGLVGLAERGDSFPAQLSGGEQQRVAIARAIARKPELLLCDEVTGALDSTTGRLVLETLVRLNERIGSTIVMITHARPIAALADRVLRIDSGRIVEVRANERRAAVAEVDW